MSTLLLKLTQVSWTTSSIPHFLRGVTAKPDWYAQTVEHTHGPVDDQTPQMTQPNFSHRLVPLLPAPSSPTPQTLPEPTASRRNKTGACEECRTHKSKVLSSRDMRTAIETHVLTVW
jgi:hypothetical protein